MGAWCPLPAQRLRGDPPPLLAGSSLPPGPRPDSPVCLTPIGPSATAAASPCGPPLPTPAVARPHVHEDRGRLPPPRSPGPGHQQPQRTLRGAVLVAPFPAWPPCSTGAGLLSPPHKPTALWVALKARSSTSPRFQGLGVLAASQCQAHSGLCARCPECPSRPWARLPPICPFPSAIPAGQSPPPARTPTALPGAQNRAWPMAG